MTPWPTRRPSGALLRLLILALVGSLLAGCVSVASRGGASDGIARAPREVPGTPAAADATAADATAAVGTSPASTERTGRSRTGSSTDAESSTLPSAGVAGPDRPASASGTRETSARVAPAASLSSTSPVTPPASEPPAADPSAGEPLPSLMAASLAPAVSLAPEASEPIASAAGPSTGVDDPGELLDEATQRRLQAILDRTTGKQRVAGVQAAVRTADGELWLGDSGSAEFQPLPRPIEDDTVFAIASVSKTFIAALVLQLAEEGKLDLDVPFGRYFRDAPRKDSATVRQLLSHTSGIYDYFANPRYLFRFSRAWLRTTPQPGLLSREHAWTYDEIMGLVKSAYCRPGTCYHYSNTNYVILGRIAEAVGQAPLDRQLRRRFFRPLGMEDTYYQPADVPPPDAAHGYWPSGGGYVDHTREDPLRPFTAAVTAAGAAGAIASTARDLSIWAAALYGGKVLSQHSLAEMTRMLPPGDYGLGTDVAVFAGHQGFGHRGGLRGFESSMWYFPDTGVSIALLSNQGNWYTTTRMASTDALMLRLVKAVIGPAHGRG